MQKNEPNQEHIAGSLERVVRRISLPTDVTRCLGGGCADADRCHRYLARNEDLPQLSYIQGGAFVEGVCLYRIEPPNAVALPTASNDAPNT